jgi:BirA family biotin operon repressor/biotin-[acetyl-CoA-carboxylase] ligase
MGSSRPRESRELNPALLARLRDANGQYVALDRLGDDPAAVLADLDALAEFGFPIERHPYQGAAYRGPASRLCPDQIEHELGATRIGRRIAVWDRVGSTSDLAARAATTPANDGLVVLAEHQTAGRGQRGRRWTVPPRSSILLSVLLFPPPELMPAGPEADSACAWLTALGAVATAELAAHWTGAEARIKWPNDVRVAGRKLAGILVERVRSSLPQAMGGLGRQGVVIGIGINANIAPECFEEELRATACSLSILAGGPVDRSEVARDLIRRLDGWYNRVLRQGIDPLSAAWRDRSEHLGQIVRVTTPAGPLRGRLVDLDLRRGLTLEVQPPAAESESPGVADESPGSSLERVAVAPGKVLVLEG